MKSRVKVIQMKNTQVKSINRIKDKSGVQTSDILTAVTIKI